MDSIKIENLEFFSNHGVLKEENVLGQKFLISAEIFLDTQKAGKNDDLALSVDYSKICHKIKNIMENNTFKLIETVAEKISEEILTEFENIDEIKIEVKKPWAPILLPLEYVSVKSNRKWHKVYLSMGSNMGDKQKYLSDAITELQSSRLCKSVKSSNFTLTKPVGYTEQDDFLNCCVEMKTLLSPHDLLEFTSSIEAKAKRERKIHWGPRTLDIDIILYDDLIMSDDKLTIPHIEMANRKFVLQPLCELNPYAINPALNMTAIELYKSLPEMLI